LKCQLPSLQASGGRLGSMAAARQALLTGGPAGSAAGSSAGSQADDLDCWGPEGLVKRVESDTQAIMSSRTSSIRRGLLGRLLGTRAAQDS
jgi:hypothetical protein